MHVPGLKHTVAAVHKDAPRSTSKSLAKNPRIDYRARPNEKVTPTQLAKFNAILRGPLVLRSLASFQARLFIAAPPNDVELRLPLQELQAEYRFSLRSLTAVLRQWNRKRLFHSVHGRASKSMAPQREGPGVRRAIQGLGFALVMRTRGRSRAWSWKEASRMDCLLQHARQAAALQTAAAASSATGPVSTAIPDPATPTPVKAAAMARPAVRSFSDSRLTAFSTFAASSL